MASLSYNQLEFMSQEMASLARAQISLPEGLRHLAASARSGRLQAAYGQIAAALDQGRTLSEALTDVSAPRAFISAIRCAEASGDMADVLEYAIEHCRRVDRFYGRLSTIVLYPALVISLALPILTFLCMFIVPKFEDIFRQLGGELPAPTQAVMQISHLLQNGVGTAILVASLLLFVWICSPLFARGMPFLLQRLPIFTELLLLSDLAMLMRFFERMLRRGIPLPVVLHAAGLAVWGNRLRMRLFEMATRAEQGLTVFYMLQGVVPPLPMHLLEQAEQRGDLIETCPGVAQYCEERFNLRAESNLRLFEPIMVILLGALIGGIIVALYLPLFNIPKLIGSR